MDARRIDAIDQWCLRTLLGVKWHRFVQSEEVWRITKQPNLTALIQSRCISIFGYTVCMDDDADRCQDDPIGSPIRELEETTRASPYHVAEHRPADLRAYNLTLNEAADLAQNRPLWRLMSTNGAKHSWWCIPEKKK